MSNLKKKEGIFMKYITVIVLHVLDLPLHLHLFKQSICSIHTGDTISRVKH